MLVYVVNRRQPPRLPRCAPHLRHCDEKHAAVNPLECALTNRDACNPFRFRSYANCRVSLGCMASFLKLYFNSYQPSSFLSPPSAEFFFYAFNALRTLLFSVGLKSFVCYSYENCRGVQSSSHFETSRPTTTSREGLLVGSSLFRSVFASFTSLLHYLLFARSGRLCHNSGNRFQLGLPRIA